jgi:hypothetical protein
MGELAMLSVIAAAVLAAVTLPPGGVLPTEQSTYDSMLAEQARAADATFSGSPCDVATVEVVAVTPWKINDRPDLLVWREKVRVAGCGRMSVENVNVGRLGGSPPWRMTSGLPGDSLADMNLQQNTYPAAVAQARQGLDTGCKVQLADVYVAARSGDMDFIPPAGEVSHSRKGHPQIALPENVKPYLDELDLSNAWMEVWPFKVCDRDRTLGVVFLPRKDRTTSLSLFLPVWQQIEAHGPGAHPAPAQPN